MPWEQMPPLDQYMLVRTRELTEKILRWYEDFEFHRIYHALNEFAVAELSSLYIDAVKDRIYTFAPQNTRAPFRANRVVDDCRSAGAPGGAAAELYRGRNLAIHARDEQPPAQRAPGALSRARRAWRRTSMRNS